MHSTQGICVVSVDAYTPIVLRRLRRIHFELGLLDDTAFLILLDYQGLQSVFTADYRGLILARAVLHRSILAIDGLVDGVERDKVVIWLS